MPDPGGEGGSEHTEGFDPCMLARSFKFRYGAGRSLRTVSLGAAITRGFLADTRQHLCLPACLPAALMVLLHAGFCQRGWMA